MPIFTLFHFAETDEAGHHSGERSEDQRNAMREIDEALGPVIDQIRDRERTTYLYVVADHGFVPGTDHHDGYGKPDDVWLVTDDSAIDRLLAQALVTLPGCSALAETGDPEAVRFALVASAMLRRGSEGREVSLGDGFGVPMGDVWSRRDDATSLRVHRHVRGPRSRTDPRRVAARGLSRGAPLPDSGLRSPVTRCTRTTGLVSRPM